MSDRRADQLAWQVPYTLCTDPVGYTLNVVGISDEWVDGVQFYAFDQSVLWVSLARPYRCNLYDVACDIPQLKLVSTCDFKTNDDIGTWTIKNEYGRVQYATHTGRGVILPRLGEKSLEVYYLLGLTDLSMSVVRSMFQLPKIDTFLSLHRPSLEVTDEDLNKVFGYE